MPPPLARDLAEALRKLKILNLDAWSRRIDGAGLNNVNKNILKNLTIPSHCVSGSLSN
jgi:hypothetical protein